MRHFKHLAELVKKKRIAHPQKYSQAELSDLLGYKNGQFISNVERGLCNVPLKMMKKISEVLDISAEDIKSAILKDHEETLTNYFNKSATSKKTPSQLENVDVL